MSRPVPRHPAITLTAAEAAFIGEAAVVDAAALMEGAYGATPQELVERYEALAPLVELIRQTELLRVTCLEVLQEVAERVRDEALTNARFEQQMLVRLRAGDESAQLRDATMEESEWRSRGQLDCYLEQFTHADAVLRRLTDASTWAVAS